jgi:hypothetical protein
MFKEMLIILIHKVDKTRAEEEERDKGSLPPCPPPPKKTRNSYE